MGDSQRPQDDDATRGLTLRELVLEVRSDTKSLQRDFDAHRRWHAEREGVHTGEARIFGYARSSIAIVVSIISALVAVVGAVQAAGVKP